MNIKRLMAGGLAALAAGSTLAFGIMAASNSLGDFVVAKDSSLTSPVIVVGETAAAKDIVSAADIAAAVAGYATTTVSTGGGVVTSVSGGIALETPNTKLHYGDATNKGGIKQTATRDDLSSVLGAKQFEDKAGNKYNYDQFVKFQTGSATQNVVTFGKSNGDLSDPEIILDIGQGGSPSAANPIYNATVNFNKVFVPNATDSLGSTIELFGVKYTIGSGSTWDIAGVDSTLNKLILFGSSNVQVMEEGDSKTVTVNGKEYTVALRGVSSATAAVVEVNGETRSVTKGNSYTIQGLEVYIDDLYYFTKETQKSQGKVSFGTSRITLANGQTVKVGQNDDSIDGTLAYLLGSTSGISQLVVAVTAKDSSHDYIKIGDCFTDTVFGTFKVCFNGLNGGSNTKVTVDNNGNTRASVKFTDYRGFEKQLQWIENSGSSTLNPFLNVSTTQKIVNVEGVEGGINDHWLLAPERSSVDVSDYGHIMKLTARSSFGSANGYVELQDVFSGDTTRVYLDAPTYSGATFYLDGNAFNIRGSNSGDRWNITWGSGSTLTGGNNVGSKTTVYPLIPLKGGSWMTFVSNATVTANRTLELPTNISMNFTNNNTVIGTTNSASLLGRVRYFNNVTSGDTLSMGVQKAGGPAATDYYPQILIVEEESKDTSGTEVMDAVIVSIDDDSGSGIDIKINTPTLTAATQSSFETFDSNSDKTAAVDRFGTRIDHNTDSQGMSEIWVPETQAIAAVAVGSDPQFSSSAGGTTVETAVKIKNPVSKLDSEVNTNSLAGDLILIGGPCANKLVAQLWAPDVTCENWAFKTGAIKEVANAFGSGQKALIVAGTMADDTRWLASQVMQGVLSWEE